MEAHAAAGVEVVAVTDHNRVDWYPSLQAAGASVGITVFPGLEFSVNGCHLLAIWDATDAGYTLASRFAATLFEPGVEAFLSNGDPRPVTRGQVLELAKDVVDHKGLVLAPHATARRMGLFASGVCSNSAEVARSDLVAGFDVCGSRQADVLVNPRSEFGDVPPRWFISGDTRSLNDVGKAAVYLKLGSTATLEGMRQAFLAPTTRIRFPRALEPKWGHVKNILFVDRPAPTWPRLRSIHIEGGFHDGLDVDFGPGLTAIIGGKGTGKSALIEIIRHVLERPGTRTEELRKNRLHNFGANADAAVGFVDADGAIYEARRSGGTQRARLFRDGAESDVRVERRITARVFGQRELQGLAEDTGELRAFVAAQAGSQWAAAVEEETAIVASLQEADEELDGLDRDLARLESDQEELVDVRERLDLAGTYNYTYDEANRLKTVVGPAAFGSRTYGYDGGGNRTSVQVNANPAITTTYNAASLPVSSSDGTTYSHDQVGELTAIDRSGGSNDWFFSYSSWNQLTKAERSPGSSDVTYTLDALGRVLSRASAGATSQYTYQGSGEVLAKAVVAGSTTTYAHTPGGPLAQKIGNTKRYYLRDLHGDLVGWSDTNGGLQGTALYDPWGELLSGTGDMATMPANGAFRFQGDLTDSATGQVDMLTRMYEPTLGRFSSRDVLFGEPTNPVSLNQYLYGAANPVTYSDPTGLRPECGDCSTRAEQEGLQVWADSQEANSAQSPAVVEPAPTRATSPTVPSSCARRCGVVGDAPTTTSVSYSYVDELQSEGCSNFFECAWWKIRASRNQDFTTFALAWAQANGATCVDRGQGLYVCGGNGAEGLNSFADGPRGGVTIGNVYLTEDDVFDALEDPDLLAHEAKHSDQWAVLGVAIVPIYLGTEGAAAILGTCGPLERLAGAEAGNYSC